MCDSSVCSECPCVPYRYSRLSDCPGSPGVFLPVPTSVSRLPPVSLNRYRQSQFAGLTRLQLDEVGRKRQVQQQGRQRAEALAERSVEIAQAMVPLAGALARGGG